MKRRIALSIATLMVLSALLFFFLRSGRELSQTSPNSGKSGNRPISKESRSFERMGEATATIFPAIQVSDEVMVIEELDFSDLSDLELIKRFESSHGTEWSSLLREMQARLNVKIVEAMISNIDQQRSIGKINAATPGYPELAYPVALALGGNIDVVKDSLISFTASDADLKKRILCARILSKLDTEEIVFLRSQVNDPMKIRQFEQALSLASSEDFLLEMFPAETVER